MIDKLEKYHKIDIFKLNKKAAMFGLDARIALATVAIISVASYSVITSAIDKASVEGILSSTKTVTKAIKNYVIDTHSIPSTIDNLYNTLPTDTSQANNWAGPYLKGTSDGFFVPSLTWTLENSNCTSTTTDSRYCVYRVSYNFCGFSRDIFTKLQDKLSEDLELSYNNSTSCIKFDYAYADGSSSKSYASFKVKEQP